MDIACPTCLNPFLLNCDISATLCGHVFHTNCIEKWLQMGNKTCPQCREFCSISFKLYLSATENVKKRDAIQADLDLAESEAKRRKSEMAKKSMLEFLFLVEKIIFRYLFFGKKFSGLIPNLCNLSMHCKFFTKIMCSVVINEIK